MNLKPDETIQKLLISTPSRLVGEYEDGELLVTHCWQMGANMRRSMEEGPASQSYYVVVFKTEPVDRKKTIVFPNYSSTGAFVASILSVLYGKRFDSHGLLESIGHFHLPGNVERRPIRVSHLPAFNHAPRKSDPIELNLIHIAKIRTLLDGDPQKAEVCRILQAAARFYSRALTLWDEQPELAFLDFVTCGEIISNAVSLPPEELYDPELLGILARVESETRDGKANADFLKSRLFQVRRRFVKGLTQLIEDSFYEQSEAKQAYGAIKKDEITDRLRAAYDLRSRYVHTGVQFGGWLDDFGSDMADFMFGQPVLDDADLKRLLTRTPSLLGLERILRHCIITSAKRNGLYREE